MTPITPLSPEAAARLAEVAKSTPAPAVRDEPADEPKRRPGLAELIEEGRALAKSIATAERVALIGSAAYLNNPGDIDFAVLVPGGCFAVAAELAGSGWASCGDYDTSAGDWCAVRRDQFNFMITHRPSFFDGYVTAMEVCKALRLEHKEDRIAVCQIVRDGMKADQVMTYRQTVEYELKAARALGVAP